MERARYNTELCSNPDPLLNNVKPSNFWGLRSNIYGVKADDLHLVDVGKLDTVRQAEEMLGKFLENNITESL